MVVITLSVGPPDRQKSELELPPHAHPLSSLMEELGCQLIGGGFDLPFRCLMAILLSVTCKNKTNGQMATS